MSTFQGRRRSRAKKLGQAVQATRPPIQSLRMTWGVIAVASNAAIYTVYLEGQTAPGSDLPAYAGSHLPMMSNGDVVQLLIIDEQVHIWTSYPQS